jgi:hypothetical protein
MTQIQQQKAARDFAQRWKGKGYEKGDSQIFWSTLLTEVFGVEHVDTFLLYEQQVHLDHTSFIDAVIPSTHVMIEQKSIKKDLGEPIKQSDGTPLNPFQQAKRYAAELPYSQRPRWIVTCNFREFWVYDMEQPNGEPQKILLENLEKEYYRLQFLVDEGNEHIKQEQKVSEEAGKLVGLIYDALLAQYHEPENPETLRSLNILCVRLVFCLYAEDAGLFNSRTAFHDFLAQYPAKDLRRALKDLFETLDTPEDQRDPYLEDALKVFPYVNGGLFSNDTRLEIPQFTEELKQLILAKASDDFDWSEISPTIFGAIFESTLNPETRRSGGMHYTSIANIHKVIDPLFLDDLKAEFDAIKSITNDKQQRQRLDAFQDKLASLTFFDPACGSGNFLTESYVSLRRLENQVILLRNKGQGTFGDIADPIKVDIHQFYGIEINDFAVSVATTALWIAEQQMLQETQKIVSFNVNPLPLKSYHNIHEGNALRLDWSEVIAPDHLNFIMGNPPFVGARLMSSEQKDDLLEIFGKKWKNLGNMDYVCGWYLKSAQMIASNTAIRAALVSTNSITQGEQVANLWKPLFEQYGIRFDFAYRTFRWDSEADIKAHVHCVIIGFSSVAGDCQSPLKKIYLSDAQTIEASNINGYLMDAPDMWIDSRNKPICDVPEIGMGNQPIDGGFYLFTESEKGEFITKEPKSAVYFHPWYGAEEFINNKKRYCLWLGDCSPAELRAMPQCYERVLKVREYRLQSPRSSTLKLADNPTHFQTENMPNGNYIVIPEVSSEKRRYIPIGYMDENVLCSNKLRLMPFATLFHFGILTSNVHMSWMRVVCGRLKSDYSYSIKIVYNNFPWCQPTEEQKARIEQTAQAILDARAKYPDCSLADLYDEVTMPPELRRAHQENDRAVMAAYGFSTKMTESECVAKLFELYQKLTK